MRLRQLIVPTLVAGLIAGCAGSSPFGPSGPRTLVVRTTQLRDVLRALDLSTAALVANAARLDGDLGPCVGLKVGELFKRLCDAARATIKTERDHAVVTTAASKVGWSAMDLADTTGSSGIDLAALVAELAKLAPLIPVLVGAAG